MMRPLAACLAAGLVAALAACSAAAPPYIAATLPPAFVQNEEVPAGDVVPLSAAKGQTRRSPFVEYPWTAHLADTVRGVRWSVDSGDAATVDGRGMLRAVRPGRVRLTARATRDLSGRLSVRVGWPLDSVAFHFAAREVMVGDTVELVFRRHYATGEVAPRGGNLWVDEPDPVTGAPKHGFTGTVAYEAAVVPLHPVDPRKSDTVVFVARQPGEVVALAWVQGRALRAALRVVPLAGRAPGFHHASPATPVRWRDRRPAGCWALSYGEWRTPASRDGDWPSEPLTAERRADYDFLPTRVELDSVPVIAWAPDVGRRIGAVGGDRLLVKRWWTPAGADDTLRLHFAARTREHGTVRPTIAVHRHGDRLAGIVSGDARAPVTGRAIPCDAR